LSGESTAPSRIASTYPCYRTSQFAALKTVKPAARILNKNVGSFKNQYSTAYGFYNKLFLFKVYLICDRI